MTVLAKSTPKRRRREETRQRLMEAGVSVFAHHGYDRATVDEIVREAGFSKGAFYVHFESKEDLFWAMLEERLARQQQAFRQTLDPSAPLFENVRTVLRGIFGLHVEDPLWSAMFMEFAAHAARDERVREKLAAMYTNWRTFAVGAVNGAREAGAVRQDIDPEFIASLLIAIAEGTISQSRLAPEHVRLEEMVEPLSRTLAEWLSPP